MANVDKIQAEEPKKTAGKIATEQIIKAKRFRKYNQDFMRALLPKDEYTLREATEIIEKFYGGGAR